MEVREEQHNDISIIQSQRVFKMWRKQRGAYNCQRLDFFFSGRVGFSFDALKKDHFKFNYSNLMLNSCIYIIFIPQNI